MKIGKTLFAQLMDFLPWSTFARIVARYGGDARVRMLCSAEQYRAMAFAQLTYRESLRGEAFDRLPRAVRRALDAALFQWSAADCLERLARGETASGLIDLIRQADGR